MDDFITMRDKILQSNSICTSSYLGIVVYLGMVLDDRLILQAGGQGTFSSRSLAGQVDLLCMVEQGSKWVGLGQAGGGAAEGE